MPAVTGDDTESGSGKALADKAGSLLILSSSGVEMRLSAKSGMIMELRMDAVLRRALSQGWA